MPLVGSKELLWYQAPVNRPTLPKFLEHYDRLLHLLEQRKVMLPESRIEFVFCEVTDTINIASDPIALSNMEEDFRVAGFDQKEISGDAMDDQERREFREMIIQGGSYRGH